MKIFSLTIALLCFTNIAHARPISYPGGWTVMSMNDIDSNWFHMHYSPSVDLSVGWRHEYLRGADSHADMVQVNNLLKRWNNPASQANLYLKSGLGIAYNSENTAPAAFTGIAADWEDRRYFVSYENRFFYAKDIEQFAKHSGRIGIAPYIGNYGDIHTWIMLQADYNAGATEDELSVTPLVRLFKGPTMLEAGYNLNGGLLFNFTHRF